MANILYILVQHLRWMATSLEWQENSYLRNRNSFLATIGKSGLRLSRSALVLSTGNDVSGHYKHNYFPFFSLLFFPFSVATFVIEGVLGTKELFGEN